MKYNERLVRYREILSIGSHQHMLLNSCENIHYVTGIDLSFSTRPYYCIIKSDGTNHLFVNELYQRMPITNIEMNIHYYLDQEKGIEQVLKHIPSNHSLYFDSALSLEDYLYITNKRRDLRTALSDDIEKMRVIKDRKEITCLKQAVHFTDTVLSQVQELIRLPSTELSVRHQLITLFAQLDVDQLNFDPIVAIGQNTVNPHHKSREVGIREGMPILIDLGCRVSGYRSDITRMMALGDFFNCKITDYFEIIREIQFGAIERIKPGVAFKEVDGFVRAQLKKHGLLDYYIHNLGHGIGLAAYEYPYIHEDSDGLFQENMTVTVGPGIYLENEFGLRVEDVVHVQAGGAVSLSNLTTEWLKPDIKEEK